MKQGSGSWLFFALTIVSLFTIGHVKASSVGTSRDYKRVQAYLRELEAIHSETANVFSIGLSGTGEAIEGLKVGNGPIKQLVVATHHGNEYGATEVAVGTLADFAATPLEGMTVYIIPVLNISGFNQRRREERINASAA